MQPSILKSNSDETRVDQQLQHQLYPNAKQEINREAFLDGIILISHPISICLNLIIYDFIMYLPAL